jgi:hypothetical protein
VTEDYQCALCGDDIPSARWQRYVQEKTPILQRVCIFCAEEAARAERRSWCVLTPHKQGPMFFTAASAREAAIGINNKGGLVK